MYNVAVTYYHEQFVTSTIYCAKRKKKAKETSLSQWIYSPPQRNNFQVKYAYGLLCKIRRVLQALL